MRADGSGWLISRYMLDSPLSRASLQVVEETVRGPKAPDVLAFVPPVGLVCWRWDGGRYHRALPTLPEVRALLRIGLAGADLAMGFLACAAVLIAAGWRLTATPEGPERAGWVTAALVASWLWHPLATLALLGPAAWALWAFGVRPGVQGCSR